MNDVTQILVLPFSPSLSNTVGIWKPSICIPETFEYQTFWKSDFKWFAIQMVGLYAMSCTRPTIQIAHQYIKNQDGVYLSCIQIVGAVRIQMAFEYQNIWHPTLFGPFENWRCLGFGSPLYCNFSCSFLDHAIRRSGSRSISWSHDVIYACSFSIFD